MKECLEIELDFSVIKEGSNLEGFDCGQQDLNNFLTHSSLLYQQRRFGITVTFFDRLDPHKKVVGFYTVCPTSVQIAELPGKFISGPKPNPIPGYRLCRLAVDKLYQGKGFGRVIFIHSLKKCLDQANQIGGSVVIIDAKNEKVASFYENHGFIPLPLKPMVLIQSLKFIDRHFNNQKN